MIVTKQQEVITTQHLEKAMSYEEYRQLIDGLLADGKTTGENHSEAMINYTKMNVQRMKRWDKTSELNEELSDLIQKINFKINWVVLTEAWCGDAAQNIPIIQKMANLNENITVSYLLRDENPTVMDAYLTNGGKSIPKVVFLKDELEELGTWGPRPAEVQEMLMEFKKNPDGDVQALKEKIHKWYAANKNQMIQAEFIELLKGWVF